MKETVKATAETALDVSPREVRRRLRFVGLESNDLERIRSIRRIVESRADEFAEVFFNYLSDIEEAAPLFADEEAIARAGRLKREHLKAMVGGDYEGIYADQRIRLGLLYSKVGLDVRLFVGAFHHMMHAIGEAIMDAEPTAPREAFRKFISLKKVAFFDIGLIADVLVFERERVIHQQQAAIRALSTPALQVRDRLLVLPIIGALDAARAKQLTDTLLQAIRTKRARVVVIDITGVAAVDSAVANHLVRTVEASRLMGADVIVTGLSAEVTQPLVALGVEVEKLNTMGDLQGGLERAEFLLGYRLVPTGMTAHPALGARSGA